MITQLRKQSKFKLYIIVSKIVSSRASTGVPLVPGYGTSPYQNDKTNKHNEQSQHPFYLPLDSFLL